MGAENTLARRTRVRVRLVPDPINSESAYERFRHRDLKCHRAPWAERQLLSNRLAWLTFHGKGDRILYVDEHRRPVSEREWIPERIVQLDAERQRRKADGDAHAD